MKIVGTVETTCVEVQRAYDNHICLEMWDDKHDEVLAVKLSTEQALLLSAALQKAAMAGLEL